MLIDLPMSSYHASLGKIQLHHGEWSFGSNVGFYVEVILCDVIFWRIFAIYHQYLFIIFCCCCVLLWFLYHNDAGLEEWVWVSSLTIVWICLTKHNIVSSSVSLVEFSSEAILSWTFICWEIFDYWLNFTIP